MNKTQIYESIKRQVPALARVFSKDHGLDGITLCPTAKTAKIVSIQLESVAFRLDFDKAIAPQIKDIYDSIRCMVELAVKNELVGFGGAVVDSREKLYGKWDIKIENDTIRYYCFLNFDCFEK